MASITKSFNKAVKKVKKTTTKAVDATKDAANTTANAVTGAANTVANEVSRETTAMTREVEKLSLDAARLAEQAYGDALAAGEAAWNEVVALTDRWLNDALMEILEKATESICRQHQQLIDSLSVAGFEMLKDPRCLDEFGRMIGFAASKQRNQESDQVVGSLAKSKQMQRVNAEAEKDFASISLGMGGGGVFGAGGEGSLGFAFGLPHATQIRGFFGLGGVVGVGGWSVAPQLGVWASPPSGLDGPYMAVGYGKALQGFGCEIQVIFVLPVTEKEWLDIVTFKKAPTFAGIVVSLAPGAEAGSTSYTTSGGNTWLF